MFDLLIINGKIIDGTSNPWFYGDIAVKDGKIIQVGFIKEKKAKRIIDVSGLFVCPGFIDIHSHSDLEPMANYRCESKVRQGVTTEVVGNCGDSAAPVFGQAYEDQKKATEEYELKLTWQIVAQYLDALQNSKPSINYAMLIGHGTIRKSVMGYDNRKPTADELEKMKELVKQAMEEGAFGISTGLLYPPGSFADVEEIIELCKVVAKYGGYYATHMRSEGDWLEQSVAETIEIGKQANISVQISHHKAFGKQNYGKVEKTLRMIEQARKNGIDVTCDVYPYTATSTSLASILPSWVHEGGKEKMLERLKNNEIRRKIAEQIDPVQRRISGYENLYISYVSSDKNKWCEGKSVQQIAHQLNKEPIDVVLDLIIEEKAHVGMIRFAMDEEDVKKVISSPYSMIGSDGSALAPYGILSKGHPHPRNYGTFPRVLARYVRELEVISLEEAIRKMTSFPAQRLGLSDRGLIKPNMAADIVVFDFDKVKDTATHEEPKRYPEGIEYVIVNGVITVEKGEHTDARVGKVLRKNSN
ncbi:N-acyl-D-amino-acid deacylase family protein [Pseudothermotoga thermarum]|uniref:N-acyl-D-amino-acid deacylase n=1 Tax=Pseudothermotoga thermarum DSM 5069 TaxID=688269 RepID=F7YTU2_9THEM|nr:D-aminoacylase [Pseudothermotoga thermarum]AEH51387.1 N-acyl-D-amino-acid deacylase [Pseudothermotoga thermarum DSM 5069]